jgi:hypothetical protein
MRTKNDPPDVLELPLDEILPSPENAELYHPVAPDDQKTIEMADSIRENGILEPLVLSADDYIISGHRRHIAARIAGLSKVPCRRVDVHHDGPLADKDKFLKLLAEHNRQRVKTRDEVLREAVIDVDPDEAMHALNAYRRRKSMVKAECIDIRAGRRRKEISPAKFPFLDAIKKVIAKLKEFLPLSLRQIHYQLLNDPPLIHADKPSSRYRSDKKSNKSLTDLATRARHAGLIPYEFIIDPVRTVTTWNVQPNLSSYYNQQMEDVLNGYARNLQQSQEIHAEIIAEKKTLSSILEPVAQEFRIRIIYGKGQCSTRPLYDVAVRYKKSGKSKLVILAVNDCNPDGDAIAHSLGQRLRDDYGIAGVSVIKVALTMEQVRRLKLPKSFERAKKKSPNYKRYIERYGTDFTWELEALKPKVLQKLLRDAIDRVLDRKAFNHEVAAERQDAAHLAAVRETVLRTLRTEICS